MRKHIIFLLLLLFPIIGCTAGGGGVSKSLKKSHAGAAIGFVKNKNGSRGLVVLDAIGDKEEILPTCAQRAIKKTKYGKCKFNKDTEILSKKTVTFITFKGSECEVIESGGDTYEICRPPFPPFLF